jgi:Phage tail repeat like
MDKINFVDYQTKVCADWLNTVSDTVWDALGQAKTPTEARQYIGAVEEAPGDGQAYLRQSQQWVLATSSITHNQLGGRNAQDAHPTSAITGLDTALAGLAPIVHTHPAADIVFTPFGGIAATNVQAALQELDNEKAALSHTHSAADITGLTASNVAFVPSGTIAAANVQAAIAELDSETQAALSLKQNAATAVQKDSQTGGAYIPSGTTAQRPAAPSYGQQRANSTLNQQEWWNGSAWVPMGGGATGASGNPVIFENDIHVTGNYTITAGKNGMSAGPIIVDNGVEVTVPNGSVWTIV